MEITDSKKPNNQKRPVPSATILPEKPSQKRTPSGKFGPLVRPRSASPQPQATSYFSPPIMKRPRLASPPPIFYARPRSASPPSFYRLQLHHHLVSTHDPGQLHRQASMKSHKHLAPLEADQNLYLQYLQPLQLPAHNL